MSDSSPKAEYLSPSPQGLLRFVDRCKRLLFVIEQYEEDLAGRRVWDVREQVGWLWLGEIFRAAWALVRPTPDDQDEISFHGREPGDFSGWPAELGDLEAYVSDIDEAIQQIAFDLTGETGAFEGLDAIAWHVKPPSAERQCELPGCPPPRAWWPPSEAQETSCCLGFIYEPDYPEEVAEGTVIRYGSTLSKRLDHLKSQDCRKPLTASELDEIAELCDEPGGGDEKSRAILELAIFDRHRGASLPTNLPAHYGSRTIVWEADTVFPSLLGPLSENGPRESTDDELSDSVPASFDNGYGNLVAFVRYLVSGTAGGDDGDESFASSARTMPLTRIGSGDAARTHSRSVQLIDGWLRNAEIGEPVPEVGGCTVK